MPGHLVWSGLSQVDIGVFAKQARGLGMIGQLGSVDCSRKRAARALLAAFSAAKVLSGKAEVVPRSLP